MPTFILVCLIIFCGFLAAQDKIKIPQKFTKTKNKKVK